MNQFFLILATLLIPNAGAQRSTTQLRTYNSTTEIPHNNRVVPRGTTVLLECRGTPHQQQIHYNWTCPHPPCDGEYRKVYNNLILIVATPTTSGRYKCTPTPNGNEVSGTLTVRSSHPQGIRTLALYNRSKLLLQNTLITDPQQIPNGLVCTTGGSGGEARFRFEDGSTILGSRQGQSTTVQSSQLNQNGRYVCFDGGREWPFHIYFSIATLPTPHVSMRTYSYNKEQLWLAVTRPEAYSSGRFILRYDCGFRGIPIELAYSSVDISSSRSDEIVTRSRSCFVVGEISRVTVWFVSGGNISSIITTVVNATSREVLEDVVISTTTTTKSTATDVPRVSNQPTAAASCPPHIPSLPLNTVILTPLTNTVPPGTTLTIGCVDGYYTDQMGTMTCGTDGQWTGTPTQCTETCKASNLTAISSDSEIPYRVPGQIRPGVVATPACGDGHHLAISAVCQDDRTWKVEEQCVQSSTPPSANTGVIVAVTVVNITILLLTVGMLVINITLIIRRRKQPSTVKSEKELKGTVQIYDEVDDSIALKKPIADAKVYQDIDVSGMDHRNQYASIK